MTEIYDTCGYCLFPSGSDNPWPSFRTTPSENRKSLRRNGDSSSLKKSKMEPAQSSPTKIIPMVKLYHYYRKSPAISYNKTARVFISKKSTDDWKNQTLDLSGGHFSRNKNKQAEKSESERTTTTTTKSNAKRRVFKKMAARTESCLKSMNF